MAATVIRQRRFFDDPPENWLDDDQRSLPVSPSLGKADPKQPI